MNRDEAKQILALYRPNTADSEDPPIAAALDLARHDLELDLWLQQHLQFQETMRRKLRQIEVPAALKARILGANKVVRPAAWWSRASTTWLAAAAALVLLLGLAALWLPPAPSNRLANFQERMVGFVLRGYFMQWRTAQMADLRASLAAHGGPADYRVPAGLAGLQLTGGGVLHWHSHPVSMVCFDRGDGQMLFLFITARSALRDPPPAQKPVLTQVHELTTASWSEGNQAYLLAAPPEGDAAIFLRKYF